MLCCLCLARTRRPGNYCCLSVMRPRQYIPRPSCANTTRHQRLAMRTRRGHAAVLSFHLSLITLHLFRATTKIHYRNPPLPSACHPAVRTHGCKSREFGGRVPQSLECGTLMHMVSPDFVIFQNFMHQITCIKMQ